MNLQRRTPVEAPANRGARQPEAPTLVPPDFNAGRKPLQADASVWRAPILIPPDFNAGREPLQACPDASVWPAEAHALYRNPDELAEALTNQRHPPGETHAQHELWMN